MKSINQIHVDHILNRIRYQCEDEYDTLCDASLEQELNYDHETEDLKTREFIERADVALADSSVMAQMLDVDRIDDVTFSAARIAIQGITRDRNYADIAELDRAFKAISVFVKSHPAHDDT